MTNKAETTKDMWAAANDVLIAAGIYANKLKITLGENNPVVIKLNKSTKEFEDFLLGSNWTFKN